MIRMIKVFEAFRSGKAAEMMDKVASVISKKIGKSITLSPESYSYQNSYGSFDGYFGLINDGDQMVRFNVYLGKSDQITSVDIYDSVSSIEPDLTIDTAGMNIVEIINEVSGVLSNSKFEVSNVLSNSKSMEERIKPGVRENPLKGQEFEEFNNIMKMSADDIFEHLKDSIYLVKRGIIKSLYVYGQPGTGKSKIVIDTLNELNAKYEIFSGGVKGTSELVRLLYRYKDNMILVLDDFDSVMRSKEQKNILKTTLQDDDMRMITYIKDVSQQRTIPERFEFNSSIIFISNVSKIDPAIKSRSLSIQVELSQEEMLLRIRGAIENIYPRFSTDIKMKIWRFLMRAAKEKKIKRIDFRQFKFCLATAGLILDKYPSSRKWKTKCLAMLNT